MRPDQPRPTTPAQSETPPASHEAAPVPSASGEELSWEERTKRLLHPLDSFVRLLDCAAANRPPDPEDRFRFQWLGLFYQAPEQDAYTLRLRLPGGRLKPFQLAGLADLTQRHASGYVLLNSQGGLDIPGVPITAAAEILEQVEGIGLTARRTGGDCVQAVRGGEPDDSPANRVNCTTIYPLVCALERALSLGPAFSDLPLPCQVVFERKDEVPGFHRPPVDTVVLRSLAAGTSPEEERAASRGGSFLLCLPDGTTEGFLLPPDRVVPACLNLLIAWAAGADRSNREKTGLATFLAALGPEAVCALLGATSRAPLSTGWQLGISRMEDEPALKLAPFDGRLLSRQLAALEQGCREQGWREVSLRRGHLCAVDADGKVPDARVLLQQTLSV